MKKYLVTGGNGFIGSNLVRELVAQKKEVHVLVEPKANLWRINDLLDSIKIYEIDLVDFSQIDFFISQLKPNIIFHLAAYGVHPDFTDQKKAFEVNFNGTVNLLNACKVVGFDCFVNTGTSSEYGKKTGPMKEDDILRPLVDYSVSKSAATQYCYKEAVSNNLPIYTVRPFGVYGDFEAEHRLIPSIINGWIQKKTINLSSPNNVRDFIYVKDVVSFYLNLVAKMPQDFFVFNIGTGIESSILNVVHAFESVVKKKLDVSWGSSPARVWEVDTWVADITRTKNILDFIPQYSLELGLRSTLKWFENRQVKEDIAFERRRI